jgi:hypothetical protein
MAGEATVRKKFEVIRSPKRVRVRPEDFFSTDHQTNLFPAPRPGLMIFVYFPDVTEEEFKATLQYAKPGSIFELRSAPRFDIGGLNRRLAFHAFEDQNSVYIDLALSSDSSRDLDHVLWEFKILLKDSRVALARPLMFLMNKDEAEQGLNRMIRQLVSSVLPVYDEVFEVPHFSSA